MRYRHGQVAEWSKAHAWNACRRGTVSRVRIPVCPPFPRFRFSVRFAVAATTTHIIHDLEGRRIAEYDFDPVSGSRTLLREYIWMGWTPLAVIEGGQVYYVRADHIGRPSFATDDTGAKVWEVSYRPFGEVHVSTGAISNLRFPPLGIAAQRLPVTQFDP